MIIEIRKKILNDKFLLSKHAVDQSIIRKITIDEIKEMISNCEIIEDYPDDKYGPSCLVYGMTQRNRALHINCNYPLQEFLKIITLYEPDERQWIDFKVRRKR